MLLHTLPVRGARNRDPRVIVGVRYVIVNTDSLTFVTEEIDVHALAINANALAIMIALPRWFFATILVPAGTIVRVGMSRIFSQIG